jgi:hypothetical protein
MGLLAGDVKVHLTTTAGSAGYTTAQGDPNASLGKYISTTEIDQDTTLHNLFDRVSGDENRGQVPEYRCVAIFNSSAGDMAYDVVLWISGRRCTATGSTNVINSTAHEFADGDTIRLTAELPYVDELPSGLNNSTTYYVRDRTSDTFKVALTDGGSAIDIGDSIGFAARRFGHSTLEVGLDPEGIVFAGASDPQGAEIANETTAPTGVTFSLPLTKAAGLVIGDMDADDVILVWLKRTPLNNGALDNDFQIFAVEPDASE